MKTTYTLKSITLAFILFGLFANFAQNEYGMQIVRYSSFLLFFLFIIGSIFALRRKKKTQAKYSEFPLFLGISAALMALGVFSKISHFPGASFLVMLSTLLILVYLIIYTFRSVKESPDTFSKVFIIAFNLFLILSLSANLFKMQHWPYANMLNEFALMGFSLSFIAVLIQKIRSKTLSFRPFKDFIKGDVRLLFITYFFFSLFIFAARFGFTPKFYSNSMPHKFIELVEKRTYNEGDFMNRANVYKQNYYNFIWKRQEKLDK